MKSIKALAEALQLTPQAVRKMRNSKVRLKVEKLSEARTASYVIQDREFDRVVELYRKRREGVESE